MLRTLDSGYAEWPAVGQGIIALQCREDDKNIISLIEKINHKETFISALVERSLLESIGGDCDTAVGGYARIEWKKITLEAELFSDDSENNIPHQENEEKEPEIFENSHLSKEKESEIKELEMFEESNVEKDFEIPAFLRRQKN